MTFRLILLLAFACSISQAVAAQRVESRTAWFEGKGDGYFSTAARNTCQAQAGIRSPDGRRKVVAFPSDEGETRIGVADEPGSVVVLETYDWPCPEIGWSLNSNLLFVTFSDGGSVGTYRVSTYRLGTGKLEQFDLAAAVRRDFTKRYPRCSDPEEPNLAGIAWSTDSSRFLLAAEVLPHSNCDNMGTFMLYEVAVPSGKILRRYSQLEAKKSFPELFGPELSAANDQCFTNPGSCWIPALHPAARPNFIQRPKK